MSVYFNSPSCPQRFLNFGSGNVTTLVLCVAMLAIAAGPAQATIVCVGTNGHIDVELALDNCCRSTPTSKPSAEAFTVPPGPIRPDCAGCTDLQLSAPSLSPNAVRLQRLRSSSEITTTIAAIPAIGVRVMRLTANAIPTPPPALRLLATVVQLN